MRIVNLTKIAFGNGFQPLLSETKSEVLPIRRPEIFNKSINLFKITNILFKNLLIVLNN